MIEVAILAPKHLSRYERLGDFNHRGRYLKREGFIFAMILDFKQFDAVDTMKRAMLQAVTHLDNIIKESTLELCLSLEGFSLKDQLELLDKAQEQEFISSIIVPEYTTQSDRLKILEKCTLKVRLMEVRVSIEEDIKALREFPNLISISSSLPLRLGAALRDLGEGPDPPHIGLDIIPDPRWAKRVVQAFVDIIHGPEKTL